jgi:predicted small integral membrane protein
MSFWDAVWLIAISFAFVAYLMMMFSIVADLFRDERASGWTKAAWLVGLIVLPFITALIYVVARGRGMAERSIRARAHVQAQQEAYIREVAGTVSATDQIRQAKAMLDSGAVTQAEYDALKRRALEHDALV